MKNRDIQGYSLDDAVSSTEYQKIGTFNLLEVESISVIKYGSVR